MSAPTPPMSPSRCQALRALLGWTSEQLAFAAGVAAPTVKAFEAGRRTPRPITLVALRRAFRQAGVDPEQAAGAPARGP